MIPKEYLDKIIFGTARLHHIKNFDLLRILIQEVIKIGINKFDIAPLYGFGINELRLSKILDDNKCLINTKTGLFVPKLYFQDNLTEYWIKLFLKKALLKNSLADEEHCINQLKNTTKLFKNKAIINSLYLHEPNYLILKNIKNFKKYMEMILNFQKQYQINNIGLAGEKVFEIPFNQHLYKINTFQTSATTFLQTSEQTLIENLKNSNEINLYGLKDIDQKILKNKIRNISSFFNSRMSFRFIIGTKSPSKLKDIFFKIKPTLDYEN